MGRDSLGTYAARGVLVPLGSCFRRENINPADYRKAALFCLVYPIVAAT